MALIEKVNVYYEQSIVGKILVYDNAELGFVYDPEWPKQPHAFPLSTRLPLCDNQASNKISPWLSNLLPEETQMSYITKVLGISSSDAMAILKEIGGDTAGAISVGEPSIRSQWKYEPLSERYGHDFNGSALCNHFGDLQRRPFLVGEDGIRISLAGGQEKSALSVIDLDGQPKKGLPSTVDELAIPIHGAPSTIIVKPDNPRLKGIVENEAYCLTLAKMIDIPASECVVMKAEDRIALVVLRYDREFCADGHIRRLHQEDFAQANGLYPSQKYEDSAVAGLTLKGILLTRKKLEPAQELVLIDQVIFNILIGNTDAHAKNYSMLLGSVPTMAPIYDVLSVPFWPEAHQHFAQRIAGKKMKPCDISKYHLNQIAKDGKTQSWLVANASN